MARRDSRLVGGIYQVGQMLSSSGPLSTYTAFHRYTNTVVGLSLVEVPLTVDRQRVEQLLQPLERRRATQSPYVIRTYDWGIDETRIYVATDPPHGLPLRYVMDNENIDFERAFTLARQMALGLQALHEQGVAGIDLRPHLITVDTIDIEDRVQLDDLGLRWLLNGLGYPSSQQPNDIGALNPAYTAPEYIAGGQIGPWSDVYQWGLLAFELVTGRLPFVGRTLAETGVLQSTGAIPRMEQYQHNIPPLLQEVVNRAMAKNPAERFLNGSLLVAALDAARPSPARQPAKESRGLTQEMPISERDATLHRDSPLVAAAVPPKPLVIAPEEEDAYAYLCFDKEGGEVQRFAINKDRIEVGRIDTKRGKYPEIDLTSLDPNLTVSRPHARITYEKTFFSIEDLKSHNYTRLGDVTLVPFKSERLQDGDVVQFGAVRLVFRVPDRPDVTVVKTQRKPDP